MHITTSKKVDLVGVSKNEDVVVLRPLTHYRVEYVRGDKWVERKGCYPFSPSFGKGKRE